MNLLLWRHADAEDSTPDSERALTAKGERQAQAVAGWLKERLERPARIVVSPATRAQQTARALSAKFETSSAIGVGASPAQVLRTAGWPDAEGTVIVVGHQPTLGQVAAHLLTDSAFDVEIKKGAVWWFRSQNGEAATLYAVMPPKLV
jgi:phosphohistidine phosphatase